MEKVEFLVKSRANGERIHEKVYLVERTPLMGSELRTLFTECVLVDALSLSK